MTFFKRKREDCPETKYLGSKEGCSLPPKSLRFAPTWGRL